MWHVFSFIDEVMFVMKDIDKMKSKLVYLARVLLNFFAILGVPFVVFFALYWWFFEHSCMVDCVKDGLDEDACRTEVCIH